jgi:hypothetical protein
MWDRHPIPTTIETSSLDHTRLDRLAAAAERTQQGDGSDDHLRPHPRCV